MSNQDWNTWDDDQYRPHALNTPQHVREQYNNASEHLRVLCIQYDDTVAAWEAANGAGYDDRADRLEAQIETLCRDIEAAGNDVAMWSERLDGVTP